MEKFKNIMNLEFEINPKYLLYVALKQEVDLEGWEDFRNDLWVKHKSGFRMIDGDFNDQIISSQPFEALNIWVKDMDALLEEGTGNKLFTNLLEETEEYRLWLLNEWQSKKNLVRDELKKILKVDIPDHTVRVLVCSNRLKCGQRITRGVIEWGHVEDWPNYSVTYLAHEYLHDVFGESILEHAVIELATDQELRVRLNKGGEYFTHNGNYVGHDFLEETCLKILPRWMEYLKQSDDKGNIFDLIRELKNEK
jgi:hypothetical protein